MPNNRTLSQLMLDSYNPGDQRQGFKEGGFSKYGKGLDLPNGLRIQAYVNESTKEVVIGTAGTTGPEDAPTFPDYQFGGYHDQFREAVEYANDIQESVKLGRPDGEAFSFFVTGHSHGGGVSQVLSNTFGWDGATFDSPQASAIVANAEYKAHLDELGLRPEGPGNLVNYTERGSAVSDVPLRNYIGQHIELDLTPGGGGLIQGAIALLTPNPVDGPLFVEDQWGEDGQHKAEKFADYYETFQDPDVISGWHYVGGTYDGWYSAEPGTYVGQNDWSGRASPEQEATLFAERERRLENNQRLEQEVSDVHYSPPHRPHEGLELPPQSTLDPLHGDGSLNPAFLNSFNNPDTISEFLESNAGLRLADAGSDVLQREYAAFVYNKALTEAAASTGKDVGQILDLDVPGNPSAPGYHYQPDRGELSAEQMEALTAFLNTGRAQVEQWRQNGELSDQVKAQQAAVQQSQAQGQGMQAVIHGAGSLVRGLDDGGLADIAQGVGQLALGVDRLMDSFETDSGILSEDGAAGVQAGVSAARFIDDVSQGNELGAISSGAYLLDDLGTAADIDGLSGLTESSGVNTGLGALFLYSAIDSGDVASIGGAGFQMADTLSGLGGGTALTDSLNGALGVQSTTTVPYASYITAGLQLIEGNEEQAALSAVSGYLMTMGPYGIAAGALLSVFGGSLIGSEPPKAWADFKLNGDGSFGLDIDSNDTGGGLEDAVQQYGQGLTPLLDQVRAEGVEVKQEYLPRLGIKDDEVYIERAGATHKLGKMGEPMPELAVQFQMGVVLDWMVDNGLTQWNRSGRLKYLGDTDWSHSVRGTGVFAGGGQQQYAPITIDGKQIVSLNDPALRSVSRQLAEVTRTWRVDKSLFAGERGALLAVGLGAGAVQYAEIARALDQQAPEPVSLAEHAALNALDTGPGTDNVIAAGYGVVELANTNSAGATPPEALDEPDVIFAPYYSGRRPSIYDDALQRFQYENPDAPGNESTTVSSAAGTDAMPVFAGQEPILDRDEAAQRIRVLADDTIDDSAVPGGGDGGGGAGGGGDGATAQAGGGDPEGPPPGTDRLSVVEDRFLVTTADRLTENDGKGVTFFALGAARNGVVALDADNNIRFEPFADFSGQAGFEYRVQTVDGTVRTQQVLVTVEARNDRPEAVDDGLVVVEDHSVALNELLSNDRDADGDALDIVAVSQVSHGHITTDGTGRFQYQPPADFTGQVQLLYMVEDPAGSCGVARADIEIQESENDPPVVRAVVFEGGVEEQAFRFTETDLPQHVEDPEGEPVTIDAITSLQGGTIDWDGDRGNVTFTPDQDFHGQARFEFTVSDASGQTSTGTATIVFENVIDPLSSGDTQLTVDEDDIVLFKPEGLLPRLNVDNPDGGDVAIVAARMIDGMPGRVNHLPDGSVQWIPPAEYSGPSAFEVRLSNGAERVVSRVDLDVRPVNDPPLARDDRVDGAVEDQPFSFNAGDLLANDHDPEGHAFSVTDVRVADDSSGALAFDAASGDVELTPAANFFGEVDVEYTLTEAGTGQTSTAAATVDFAPVDDTVLMTDKTFTTSEDEAVVFGPGDLLDAQVDPDGESITITDAPLHEPAAGSIALLSGGGVRYTPAADYFGAAGFDFDYSDGVTTHTATVALTVTPENDPPRAGDDRFTGGVEDQPFSFNTADLIAKDNDPENDPLAVTAVRLLDAEAGTVSFDPASGDVTLVPAADVNGEARLAYTLEAGGQQSTGSATVVFAPRDDTASITDKAFVLLEDETRVFTREALLDVTRDVDGEALHITDARLAEPAAGSLELLDSGGVRFVPAAEYSGQTSFEFDHTDGVTTHTSQAQLTVEPVNDAPDGLAHRITGALEDQVFEISEIDLLNGATDPEGDSVHLETLQLKSGEGGELQHDPASGRIVYTPEQDFFGEVKLAYRLADERGVASTHDASIVFQNIDDDFTVTDRAFTLGEDEARIFTREALLDAPQDADGQTLQIDAVRLNDPSTGTVQVLTSGNVRFEPAPEYSGDTSFEYDVTDGINTHTAVARLTILEENDAPVARDDYFANAVEDTSFVLSAAELLSNDSDPEGDAFELTGIEMLNPDNGTASFDPETGRIELVPAADFNGEARLAYTLTEAATGQQSIGNVTIDFQPVDDPPEVSDKDLKEPWLNLDEDQVKVFAPNEMLDHLVDVDGETLSISGVRMLDGGTGQVSLTGEGGVRFEPAPDYVGDAPFEVDVTDGNTTVSATMTPTLWPVNDAPRVTDDQAVMDEGATLTVRGADLLANDQDVDGGHDDLRIVGTWGTSAGVVGYDTQADTLRFTPPEDLFGDAWVDYIVEDGEGAFSVARLNVAINNLDDPVVAADDVVHVAEDTDQVFDPAVFLANDANQDDEALAIVAIDDTSFDHGQLQLTAGGALRYAAAPEFYGSQTFNYTVADQSGNQSTASVELIVDEVNDAPRVVDAAVQILEDHSIVFDVNDLLGNATDVEDDWMQVAAARSSHGTVEFDAMAGKITFTPVEHLNSDLHGGPLVFEYLVADEKRAETWGRVDIDVVPVNDPPQAGDDLLFAWEAGPGGYTNVVAAEALLANDIEVDGEAIHIDRVTSGSHGAAALDDINNEVRFRADTGFVGRDSFTYRVTDGVVESDGSLSADTGTVAVKVMDNHAPLAHDFATVAAEDTVLRFTIDDFMQHVDDEDLGILELPEDHCIVEVKDFTNGSATLNDDGSVSFTPTADYNSVQHGGVASFDYVVEDIVGHRSEATASMTYTPVNDDPVAVDDGITQTILEEQAAFINIEDLLANDFDVDDNPGENSVRFDGLAGGAGNGSVSVVGEQIRYQGHRDFFGNDSFRYRVIDGEGGEGIGTVRLYVANVNDRPRVEFDSARVDDSGTNTIGGLLNNDSDADGDTLRIVNPSKGSVANGGTAIRFNADNRGHDYNTTITYGVTDGQETVQSRVDLHVIHVNRPPTGLTTIKTDSDSVFVAGQDPDTSNPTEIWGGGTLSLFGHSWDAQVGISSGTGAGQEGLFIDVRNQWNHPVSWPDPNQAIIRGTGTFSYKVGVYDGDTQVVFNKSMSIQASLRNTNFTGIPVVIDVNGDGLNLLSPEESQARFDWNDDGLADGTGWIAGEGDALLAYDHDGDNRVTRSDEISFAGYRDGAKTDLEGLGAFDSNDDGVFDRDDDQWSLFGLWVDDGDAESDSGELIGMDESGVASLDLSSDEQSFEVNGNTVHGLADVGFSDGSRGELGDVAFAVDLATEADSSDGSTSAAEEASSSDNNETEGEEPAANAEADAATSNEDAGTASAGQTSAGAREEALLADGGSSTDSGSNAIESAAADDESFDEQSDAGGNGDAQASAAATEDDLPSDEELDRMAQSDNSRAASQEPDTAVAPIEVDTALSDSGWPNQGSKDGVDGTQTTEQDALAA